MRCIVLGIGLRASRIVNEILRNSRDPLSPGPGLLPLEVSTRRLGEPHDVRIDVMLDREILSPKESDKGFRRYLVAPGTYEVHVDFPEGEVRRRLKLEERGARITAEAMVPKVVAVERKRRISDVFIIMASGVLPGLLAPLITGAPQQALIGISKVLLLGILFQLAFDLYASRAGINNPARRGGLLYLAGAAGMGSGWLLDYAASLLGVMGPEQLLTTEALAVLIALISDLIAYIYAVLRRISPAPPRPPTELWKITWMLLAMFVASVLGGLTGGLISNYLGRGPDLNSSSLATLLYSSLALLLGVLVSRLSYRILRFDERRFRLSAALGAASFLITVALTLYLAAYGYATPWPNPGTVIPSLSLLLSALAGIPMFIRLRSNVSVRVEEIPLVPDDARYGGEVVAMVLQEQEQPLDRIDLQQERAGGLGIRLKYPLPPISEIPSVLRSLGSGMRSAFRVVKERTGAPLDVVLTIIDLDKRETIDKGDPVILSSLWSSSIVRDTLKVPSVLLVVLPRRTPSGRVREELSCRLEDLDVLFDPSLCEYLREALKCHDSVILMDPNYMAVEGSEAEREKTLSDHIVRRICPLLEPGSYGVTSASGVDAYHVLRALGVNGKRRFSTIGHSSAETAGYDPVVISSLVSEALSSTSARSDPSQVEEILLILRGRKELISLTDAYQAVKRVFRGALNVTDVQYKAEPNLVEAVALLSGVSPEISAPCRGKEELEGRIEEEKRKLIEVLSKVDEEIPRMSDLEKKEALEKLEEAKGSIWKFLPGPEEKETLREAPELPQEVHEDQRDVASRIDPESLEKIVLRERWSCDG